MKTTTHPPLPSPANPARYDGHGGEFSAPEGWSAEQMRAYYDLSLARIAELEAEIAGVVRNFASTRAALAAQGGK